MVIVGIVVVLVAIGAIWYVVARGRGAELVTERDFDEVYDGDAQSAWDDFHAWQVGNEAERRSWEDPDDG